MPERYRVFALDLRGHGDSDRPASGYSMRELAGDVIAFMNAKGLRRATVIGHSMGSMVAQQVALAAPDRVARLVLVGPGRTGRQISGIAELEAAVDSLTDPVPVDFVDAFQKSTVYRPLPAEFMEQVNRESLKLPARVWRGLMDGMLAMPPAVQLKELAIPTLILWGERDAVFLRPEQDAMLRMLPHAVFKALPETGHALHWERPGEFVRELEAFVGGGEVS
jgi:pimeloyl-ACP methyl ester carboxylesterase